MTLFQQRETEYIKKKMKITSVFDYIHIIGHKYTVGEFWSQIAYWQREERIYKKTCICKTDGGQ